MAALMACGRVGFAPIEGDGGTMDVTDATPCTFGPWSTPIELASLGSTGDDFEPALSPDGTLLVFSSNRTGAEHLYQATRDLTTGAYGPATMIATLISPIAEYGPAWDGASRLYFGSGASPRLFQSTVTDTGFSTPGQVPELASDNVEAPTISTDGLEMIYTQSYQLHRARRTTRSSPWMVEGPIAELATGGNGYPSLSGDGLTLYFDSDRMSPQGELFSATRPAIDAPFANVTRLAELDDVVGFDATSDPDLAPDGTYLVMAARRGGTWDLFEARRACQ